MMKSMLIGSPLQFDVHEVILSDQVNWLLLVNKSLLFAH